MPTFGLGTYHMTCPDTMTKAVMELNYEMFDCASFYKNEKIVG